VEIPLVNYLILNKKLLTFFLNNIRIYYRRS